MLKCCKGRARKPVIARDARAPSAPQPPTATIPLRPTRPVRSQETDLEANRSVETGHLRQQPDLALQDGDPPENSGPPNSGAGSSSYQGVIIQGSSRALLGNIHARDVAFNTYSSEARLESDPGEALMKALAFDSMGFRLATISQAYGTTCSWIVKKPEYIEWKTPEHRVSHHGILWVKGNPGVGKSTVMKYMLEHASRHHHESEAVLHFFFNGRGLDIEKSTEGMYRSLLYQILKEFPRLRATLSEMSPIANQQSWPVDVLKNLFQKAVLSLRSNEQITCFVDALDECQIGEVRQAMAHFEELGALAVSMNINLHICFASRYYPNITIAHHETVKLDDQKEHEYDISEYVRSRLSSAGSLKDELVSAIQRRSSGVFLWVVLVMGILKEKSDNGSTRSELLASLEAVPKTLHDLFGSILESADDSLGPALQWVLFAELPLSVADLYFAIRTAVGQLSTGFWDKSEIDEVGMERYIIHTTRGLVEITDGRKPVAQFIHESVKDYLLDDGLTRLSPDLEKEVQALSHAQLARWCLNYIQLDLPAYRFDGADRCNSFPFATYCVTKLFHHAEAACTGKMLPLSFINDVPLAVWLRLVNVLDPEVSMISASATALYLILKGGCVGLAQALLDQYHIRAHQQHADFSGSSSSESNHSFVELNINTPCGGQHGCALASAAARGDSRIVQSLLDCGADINLWGGIYGIVV